jgi:hypothetical protein
VVFSTSEIHRRMRMKVAGKRFRTLARAARLCYSLVLEADARSYSKRDQKSVLS